MASPFTQPPLFSDIAGPVRSTDPTTSAEAAKKPGKSLLRLRVLNALLLYGDMHDERIAEMLGELEHRDAVVKRRGELVGALLAEPVRHDDGSLVYAKTSRGGRTMVWRLTPAGRQAAMEP